MTSDLLFYDGRTGDWISGEEYVDRVWGYAVQAQTFRYRMHRFWHGCWTGAWEPTSEQLFRKADHIAQEITE